jgi:hypothetical protein
MQEHNSFRHGQELARPGSLLLVLGKAFRAAAKYLYAGLEETGIHDTDFRILEVLTKQRTFASKYHRSNGEPYARLDQHGHGPPRRKGPRKSGRESGDPGRSGRGPQNRICQIWCEGIYNDLENRWLESMPGEYIASYKPTARQAVTTSRGACRVLRASEFRSRCLVGVRVATDSGFAAAFQAKSARSQKK